ncbi:glutamyl-tRNA reductase [Pseudolysinimonas kribbensis]|uniref:glutamyl-tRNA reductase n=1 Tax=Pseudolysinimonas kribbensis TaxID=433641 RepID=UPI0031D2D4CA
MLFCVTASHRDTEFDVLDRVSRRTERTARELTGRPGIRGAIVLATCNRFEAYLEVEPDAVPSAADAVFDALGDATGDDARAVRATARVLEGDAALQHLFAVAAGLESMVVGEDEISGQVQRALAAARADGTVSAHLDAAFQRAARTSRTVRSAVDLGGAGRSIARLALDLASSRIADWSAAAVLVVGTGQYAATTIAGLRARGATDIRVFSATGRADGFATRFGVRAEHDLPTAIGGADLVITCTARYTVLPEHVPDERERLIIDLGLPRNVDPAVARVPGVELLDLELLALHAPLPELGGDAHRIVDDAVAEYAAERAAAPGIVAFRRHVLGVLGAELERARAHGADEATLTAMRHLTGVLVHGPSVRARELAASGRAAEFEAGLEAIFDIRVEAEDRLGDQRDATA